MNWKQSFLESVVLGQSTNKNDPITVKRKCVEVAYRDMMTAGRYYSKSFLHSKDEICYSVIKLIESRNYLFSRNMIETVASAICDDRICDGNRFVTGYGLAQKIVNMTYKYLYVFSDYIFIDCTAPDFSLCDCPLDSIILNKASLNQYTWSKLDKTQYEDCQRKIANYLKKPLDEELAKLGNLAFDFISW